MTTGFIKNCENLRFSKSPFFLNPPPPLRRAYLKTAFRLVLCKDYKILLFNKMGNKLIFSLLHSAYEGSDPIKLKAIGSSRS